MAAVVRIEQVLKSCLCLWVQNVAAVVLRIDSPGGDALASDLMWHAIKRLRKTKPVVASFGDVSASGQCDALVVELPLVYMFFADCL